MRPFATTLLLLALSAAAASGEARPTLPVGSGVLAFEERFRVGDECKPYAGTGLAALAIFPNGAFTLDIDAGRFSGFVVPADAHGRAWTLRLDERSLAFYRLYLEAGARVLCGAEVRIAGGGIETFGLRLTRDGREVVLRLRTNASGASEAGAVRGRHRLDAQGAFERGLVPPGEPPGGGSVGVPSRSRVS